MFLHRAALAYANPTQIVWLVTDPQSSVLVDASFNFIHLFRMGLFFLISGYFARLMITRRGLKSFLWNRFVRILCPFILFYPFLMALIIAVIVFAMSYLSHPLGLMGVIVKAAKENPQGQQSQPLTTLHLWFLYYLLMFAALTVVLSRFRGPKLEWLLRRPWLLRSPRWRCCLASCSVESGSPRRNRSFPSSGRSCSTDSSTGQGGGFLVVRRALRRSGPGSAELP